LERRVTRLGEMNLTQFLPAGFGSYAALSAASRKKAALSVVLSIDSGKTRLD
jgi:hypothetical protein